MCLRLLVAETIACAPYYNIIVQRVIGRSSETSHSRPVRSVFNSYETIDGSDAVMAYRLLVVLLIISLLETNKADITKIQNSGGKRTLDDVHSHRHHQDMYQEMMRVIHESKELPDEDDTRLRRIVGEDNFKFFQGGVGRRRGGGQLRSAVGRRRARSQALRREKLNSQGLRSHMLHTRQAYDDSPEGHN
ncbi:uncharacterized protein LOC114361884 [Ostrinia furnacalis]|uniref:uncharacterized protein LOC114361884 n=1 Tax=Ostrinia furnacalis TaxID=93504 RepID=UPI00103B7E48|nr:uncharacterized protein LOC114361884 [Ostrinia furnacalis]